ncbi:cell division protein ZapA [Jannaschia donghaensis]|uniref:Cell division protein ZapA n=1 Tax=Jannaschia donghaensis TaxID=420998 RepID=A0A0M6YNR5_9RHOB|nr:cell division protein ZapA [Jannaschia donghaensis]CTQ50887.1 Cell division protein ZapA [Jannaschia donghaensis]
MPDMTIDIGGNTFTVACQDGEEGYLTSAAELLDREAQVLVSSGARLTQEKMLLMAGLMLADKTISADEELRALDRRLAQQTKVIDEMQARPVQAADTREVIKEVEVVREVPVEVIPDDALTRLDALADRAEALVKKATAA